MTSGLFMLAWFLGIGSWFIALIELLAIHSFSTVFFNLGIPVYKRTVVIEAKNLELELNKTIKKTEGKFQLKSDNKIYFLSQLFLFKMVRFSTPFPLRATGKIRSDNKIDIIARIPLGSTLFIAFWLGGWTIGTVEIIISTGQYGAIGFGLIGFIFAGFMMLISYPIEKGRLNTMINELKSIITEHNPQYAQCGLRAD